MLLLLLGGIVGWYCCWVLKIVAQGITGENRVKERQRRGEVRELGLKKNRTKISKKIDSIESIPLLI